MSNLKDTIVVNGKETKLKVTAYTALLYEDNFKGSCFLKDVEEATAYYTKRNSNKFPTTLCLKMLWASAKTANEDLESFVNFTKNLSLSDILKNSNTVIDLIWEAIKTSETTEKN